MDPTVNLKEQLGLAREVVKVLDDCNGDGTLTIGQLEYLSGMAGEIAERITSLHEWISKGGALPEQWVRK